MVIVYICETKRLINQLEVNWIRYTGYFKVRIKFKINQKNKLWKS